MVVRRSFATLTAAEHSVGVDGFDDLPTPSWLKEGELGGSRWLIEIDDPELRRHTKLAVDFAVPVAPGRFLTDAGEWKDLRTLKLFVYYSLTGPNAWLRTTSSVSEEFRGFLAFLRWRNNRGLPQFSCLTPEWFREFCESLQSDGLEGLLRTGESARSFVENALSTEVNPPHQPADPKVFSLDGAAKLIGLDNSRQLSDRASEIFNQWALSSGMSLPRLGRARNRAPKPREKGFCGASLDRYMRVWERLARIQHHLTHDQPGYLPFASRKESVGLASAMGRPIGRTPTAPAMQTCHLIDRALRWVLLYADGLMSLVDDALRHFESGPQPLSRLAKAEVVRELWNSRFGGMAQSSDGSGLPSIGYLDGKHQNTFDQIQYIYLKMLATACGVVVAAFSARRFEEIVSLRDDCIEQVGGEKWLRTYIVKSLRGRERIPAPTAVVKALEVMTWLSATARESEGGHWLFQAKRPLKCNDKIYPIRFDSGLVEFAAEVRVPALPDGSHWVFTPHQFRRFFAVVYYYRYRDRSLTALSQYLCHYDPDSTRTYITEARLGGFLKMVDQSRADREQARRALKQEQARLELFDEVGLQLRVEVFSRALEGLEPMSGWAGQRILNELRHLKAKWENSVEVGSFEGGGVTLDEVIIGFAKTQVLEPNGQGHSYCACRNSEKDLSVAGCILEGRRRDPSTESRQGPDLRFAADMTCAACPHNVQLRENREYWEALASNARALCESCPGSILARRMAERCRLAEEHLVRFHGGATT